jgi:hypothetical protein
LDARQLTNRLLGTLCPSLGELRPAVHRDELELERDVMLGAPIGTRGGLDAGCDLSVELAAATPDH